MSDLRFTLRFQGSKGNYQYAPVTRSQQYAQTAAGNRAGIQNIGTTAETLDSTGLTTPKYLYLENLDATNYVEIVVLDGAAYSNMGRLQAGSAKQPGDMLLIPVAPSVTVQLKANTAACNVYYQWLEA